MKERLRQQWQQLRGRIEPHMAPAIRWYREREPREQQALQLLAVSFGLVFAWVLIWQPVSQGVQDSRQEYERQQQILMWLQDNREAVEGVRARRQDDEPARAGEDDWIDMINTSAGERDISLAGFTPEGDRAVRISLERQEFASVMSWFQHLEDEYGVHASTVDLSAGREPGTVDLRATLRRSS